MKIVFVCAPFRGRTPYEVWLNTAGVENFCALLGDNGVGYIAPHLNSRNFHGCGEEGFWLEMYQEILKRCDVVAVLGEPTVGMEAELDLAYHEGLPIRYQHGLGMVDFVAKLVTFCNQDEEGEGK